MLTADLIDQLVEFRFPVVFRHDRLVVDPQIFRGHFCQESIQ